MTSLLRRVRLRARLLAAFGVFCLLVGAMTGVAITQSGKQADIAAAVEEQSATTTEINRNVSEVATGSQQIADHAGRHHHPAVGAGAR